MTYVKKSEEIVAIHVCRVLSTGVGRGEESLPPPPPPPNKIDVVTQCSQNFHLNLIVKILLMLRLPC